MKILFFGQLGLRAGMGVVKTARERRIEQLGRALVAAGHDVTVLGTHPFTDATVTNYYGIDLKRRPGGRLYLLTSLMTLWREQPDIVHIHSWRAAALVPLAILLSPESSFIWTIDSVPTAATRRARLAAKIGHKLCDGITTSTRALQYTLLQNYQLATYYIPDGYVRPTLKDIPYKNFGLRKGQYNILLAHSEKTLREVLWAYAVAGIKKKLVILADPATAWLKLINNKSFLAFVGPKQGRQRTTLIRGADKVLATQETDSLESILQAMDSGKHIISANTLLLQETLGVTAQFYTTGKSKELATLLSLKTPARGPKSFGAKAQRRAQAHFTWHRIIPEYLAFYRYSEVSVVPVDSARTMARKEVRA